MSIKIKLFAAIKAAAEVLVGLSAGAAASAGVFALITVIGILPRWAGHTRTARHVSLYEWSVILGGTAGNLFFYCNHHCLEKKFLRQQRTFYGDLCRRAYYVTSRGIRCISNSSQERTHSERYSMDGAFNWHWKNVRCIFVLLKSLKQKGENMVSEEQKKEYQDYVKEITPTHNTPRNIFRAFWTGGTVCVIGQFLRCIF